VSIIKAQFTEQGYYAPVRILSEEQAAEAMRRYTELQQKMLQVFGEIHRFKLHLLVGWLADIVRHRKVLDIVEELLGPNILCWSSDFFAKPAHDPGFVSLHQDTTYAGLTPYDGIVNVWLAFTPSNTASGCLQVIPGTHKLGQIAHVNTFARDNMLFFGQTVELDRTLSEKMVDLELEPGQASLHHMAIVHGSQPNHSDLPRVGCVLRYISPEVRQSKAADSATLVRGENTTDHFALEALPQKDWSDEAVAAFREALHRPSALG
jgi:ectoine hydroxylase-related dioxygenase (phytanoyl-CoA dioxygenase family)